MSDTIVTIKLRPDEYRRVRFELTNQLEAIKAQYQVAVDGKWHHNPDGRALAQRQLTLEALLETL